MLIFYPWVSSWWGLSNPDGSLVVVLEGSWCYNVNGRIFPRHIRTWFIRFTKQRFKFINTKITTSLTWCLVLLVLTPGQNVTFFKVVFKIYFKPFWVILEKKNLGEKWGGTPILSHFSPISAILKIFTSVLTFLGGKNFFFAKVPQWWSSFLKKIHCIFRYIRGGRGGVRRDVTNVTFFFLIFFEGFPKLCNFFLMFILIISLKESLRTSN